VRPDYNSRVSDSTLPTTTAADTPVAASVVPAAPAVPAWRSAAAIALFLSVAVGGLTLDLWSKHWAFHTLRQGGHQVVIPGVLEWQTMFNKGALFGIGQGKTWLFLSASALALVLVSWMFARSDARRWLLHIALAGILAGALGNMYDRINVTLRIIDLGDGRVLYFQQVGETAETLTLREYPPEAADAVEITVPADEMRPAIGAVRDFIKIPTKLWGEQDLWPWVFNVADMLLVGGVGILAVFLWRDGEPKPPKPREPPATDLA
jgi:lipoprotein signal peptidase